MKATVASDEVQAWRKKYLFLPKWLRDFHVQKDLFKTIHESVDISKAMPSDDNELNWVTGMCYVIDVFLWFMARHGYTLQKSHTKLDFNDIDDTLEYWQEYRSQAFARMLEESRKNERSTTS